jgi:hypothetical protein
MLGEMLVFEDCIIFIIYKYLWKYMGESQREWLGIIEGRSGGLSLVGGW